MPDPLTTLVGRDWEATEVGACLARPDVRLVTLTGPGGVGKTRLALRVATECEGLFEEGVCFVGLAQTTDPDHVLLAVARTLEIRCLGGERLVDLLASALDGRRLLLVLDNLEQVRGAAPRLVELLVACSGLKILATSREVLHVSGEHRYPVPPLSLGVPRPAPPSPGTGYADPVPTLTGSDAVGLFVDRARAVRPDFALDDHNVVLVAAICRRVDCLPLGIELAAARLRHLSLSSLLDLLDRRLPVLTGGPRDSPVRLRTMHDAIAWSCDLLTPQERAAFSRLSVFAGGFDLRAAETILRDDADPASPDPSPVGATRRNEGPAVIDIVSSLVDKSLLRIVDANDGRTRYGMLETVREFGLTRLAEEEAERDIRLRHLAWCQALAAPDAAPDDAGATRWLGRLDDDHPNITAALEWAIDDGNAPPIGPFVLALAPYWEARGHFVEGIRWLEMAVERDGGAPAADRLAMMSGAGTLAWLQGDFDRATHWHGQALILARAVGDRVAEAFAQNNLGVQAV
ncbi:MAG: AAA family ATPase, partial [Thermomicrobiales bacterium]